MAIRSRRHLPSLFVIALLCMQSGACKRAGGAACGGDANSAKGHLGQIPTCLVLESRPLPKATASEPRQYGNEVVAPDPPQMELIENAAKETERALHDRRYAARPRRPLKQRRNTFVREVRK